MERNSMGLSSKDPLLLVKEESAEGGNDSVDRSFQNNVSLPGMIQNFAATHLQLGGNIPVKPPQLTFASHGSVAGNAAPWFNSKSSMAPSQLTIFYGGTVNVYNDISPEKAQAIMLLAGNVTSQGINMSKTKAQVHISSCEEEDEDNAQASDDGLLTNGTPSPVSVSSRLVGGPTPTSEVEQIGVSASPIIRFGPPKVVGSIGSLAATTMIRSAIPQSRKLSLACFLEKRKERVMNSAPYNLCKKSSKIGTPAADGVTSSVSISTGNENI